MIATLKRRLRPSATDRAFRTLVAEAGQDVRALVDALVMGDLLPSEWADQMQETLASAHAEAGYRGRLRAGDMAPFDRDDVRFGALVAQEEARYLWDFTREIERGKYGYPDDEGGLKGKAILRRALMYTARLVGTANEALMLVAGDEETWIWEAEPEPCPDCAQLAAHSPYRGQPPTMPGQNATRCLASCRCVAYTTSGLRGFAP